MNLDSVNWSGILRISQLYSFGIIPVVVYLWVRMKWDAVVLERLDDQAFYTWRAKTFVYHMLGYLVILLTFTFFLDRGNVWAVPGALSPLWYFGIHAVIITLYGGCIWLYYVYPARRVARGALKG